MNSPKISIITPVKDGFSPYQIANHVSLTLQENQQWELIAVSYGDHSNSLKNDLMDGSKVFVFEGNCKTMASAVNFGLAKAQGEYVVVVQPNMVLGVNFISECLSELESLEINLLAVPTVLTHDTRAVREVGFGINSMNIECFSKTLGNMVVAGKKGLYPNYIAISFSELLHVCSCIERSSNALRVISSQKACVIEEYVSPPVDEESQYCNEVIGDAFNLGFSFYNALQIIQMFGYRKNVLTDFIERYDKTLDFNQYVNIFFRKGIQSNA